jgi:hypothetical protein
VRQTIARGDHPVAGEEPVVAPDQLKPGHRRSGRIGAIVVALSLAAMTFGNNVVTGAEKLWVIGIAVALVGWVVLDSILRRSGLRS